jgi:MucB/RseB N-terminal domain
MTVHVRAAIALAAFVMFAPAHGFAADERLRGIAIDLRLDAEPLPADLVRLVPTIVRLSIDGTAVAGPGADATLARLQDVLGLYQARQMKVVLALGSFPAADGDVEAWRQLVRAVAERSRGHVAGYQIGDVQAGAATDVSRYVYLLKLTAVQIRAVDADALVLQGGIPAADVDWQERVFAAGAGPYVDGIALEGPAADEDEPFRLNVERMAALAAKEKPSAIVLLGPIHLPADPAAATSRAMDAVLRWLGTSVQVTFSGDAAAVGATLTAAARVTDLIAGDLVTLDERTADLRILQGAANITSTVTHRLMYSLTAFETYLVYWSAPNGAPIDIEVTVQNVTTPMVRDPRTGASQAPARVQKGPPANRLRIALPAADHPLIVDFNFGNSSTLGSNVDVRTDALPQVGEIIFRHQRAQAAQDAILQTYIAHVRIEQHFHPSPADPAYNLVTENRLFSEHGAVEWEELSFELNGAKWTANRPPFPLVQAEKVLSLPLDLRLNQDYTYRLDGLETVGDRPAFVVRFDPADPARALYRGTVWIDRQTYVKLKVQAVETRLSGPIVSNDETQVFEQSGSIGERPIWLLNRLSSKQIFLIAGRSVLIEREVRLTDFVLNSSEFDRDRSAARASDRIMYRDTDAGVRYLVKQGEARVVSDKLTTSARAFVLGADIDPSFDTPLPIGGINILDFNFLNRNMQLALLFGGVIAFGNIQHANLWGGKFDASVDFFGLALKANDDLFDAQGKRSGERVNRIPVAAGLNLGYQMTPFQKLTGHYEFKYDAYSRDATTASSFVIPSSTATNGEGVGYEYRRRGYSLLANAIAYRRSTWDPWSQSNGFDAGDRTFTKYDVGLSKDFTFATFHNIHLNGSYFGGQRLDRFSLYQFGMFDATRMHGVPAAVRFGELGMFRGSYSFNLFDIYRLDLFLDHARGRDPEGDTIWRQVTGTGIRLNLRAPRNTILQVDFGKSVLPDVYRGAGSMVLQILLLKPL